MKALILLNEEKDKIFTELIIANKELAFQNDKKEKRAAELVIANKELGFQNSEKVKRAAELTIANNRKKASEVRYRRLFETAKDGVIILNAETGEIEDVNPFLIEILGYSKEEFIGKELWEIGLFKDILINKEAFFKLQIGGHIHYENLPLKTKQGRPIWVEFVSNAYVSDGKTVMQCNIRDITERHNAAEKLRQSNKKFQEIVETALEGIMLTDKDSKTTFINKRFTKIFGYSSEEMAKKAISDLIDEDWKIMAKAKHENLLKGIDETFEMVFRTKSDEKIWINASASAIMGANGEYEGGVAMLNDITRQKLAEIEIRDLNQRLEEKVVARTSELSEANKSLEAFTGMVSHDLRAPVRAVSSFAKIIQDDYAAKMEPKEKELFAYIEDSANRMNVIIEDLLKLARSGSVKLKSEPVNMKRLIEGVWLNISRTTVHHASLELKVLPVVKTDESLMHQVVENLLANAIKYSSKKEKPVVTVWSEQTAGKITFYFKDNGAGFDMKNYDRLFGTFQRLHNRSDFEGTGVGLSLVKRIIEKHGGTVGAEAKVGEGAMFYFTLPVL